MQVTRLYGSSRGFLLDLLKCIAQNLGFSTHSDKELASAIRANITAMGGVGNGGSIHLLAHSQGGLIARNALSQLSSLERQMIEVTTFGSADFFYFADLKSFEHIVNRRDFIKFLSPLSYLSSCLGSTKRHISSIHSQNRCLIDHCILSETYLGGLKKTCSDILAQMDYRP